MLPIFRQKVLNKNWGQIFCWRAIPEISANEKFSDAIFEFRVSKQEEMLPNFRNGFWGGGGAMRFLNFLGRTIPEISANEILRMQFLNVVFENKRKCCPILEVGFGGGNSIFEFLLENDSRNVYEPN